MKKKILAIVFVICFKTCFSQQGNYLVDLSLNMWNNFSFTINGVEQTMNLYFFDDTLVKGRYYENCQSKILFEGTRKQNVLSLEGYCNNKIYCYITFTMDPDSAIFHGFWYDSLKAKKIAFTIREEYGTPGTVDRRYSGFGDFGDLINDDEVEAYAKAIKTAVISGDKEWIADQITYPITIWLNKKDVILHSKEELLNNYDKLITPEVKDRMRSACPFNLQFWQQGASMDVFRFNSRYNMNKIQIVAL